MGSSLLIALSMYSILPVPRVEWKEDNMRWSLACLPVVGLLGGGLRAGWAVLTWTFPVSPIFFGAVAALLPQVKLGIRLIDGAQHIYLNGEDVSTAIRAEEIGMAASAVAAHPAVRSFLLDTQRGLAESQNILMDGRDIGTVVLPNATVKIFLTASAEARAQRRAKELAEKGQPADFATVLADIRQRDYQDSHRAVAPLKQADDAILVDTSSIGLQESFDLLKRTILAHI